MSRRRARARLSSNTGPPTTDAQPLLCLSLLTTVEHYKGPPTFLALTTVVAVVHCSALVLPLQYTADTFTHYFYTAILFKIMPIELRPSF